VKPITTGEGGVVTTVDAEVARRVRELRNHGIVRDPQRFENRELGFDGNQPNPWYYEMAEIGWNYRLPDVLCALGQSQLRKLPRFWCRRQEISALYDRLLEPLSSVVRAVPHGESHGWHLYVVLIDFARLKTTRAALMNALRADGIMSQVHYVPVHLQPYYQRRYGQLSLPGADAYYEQCLSLPIFPAMSDDDVCHVVRALGRILAKS
jgi:dTDP-4-amino-4,6-dideoxygalactose transaminase